MTNDEPLDLLVLSPHPDDAELFAGGALLSAAADGRRTGVVDLTEGELGTNGTVAERCTERERASDLLGLSARVSLGLPDGSVGEHPGHREALAAAIRRLRPRVVLAPWWRDRHPDHAATGRLAASACFLAGVARHGEGPPHRPERLYHYMLHEPFVPSLILDVTTVWERRKALFEVYASQIDASQVDDGPERAPTAINRGRFLRTLEARATWYGAQVGVDRGEPILCNGPVRLASLPELARPAPLATDLYRVYP